MVQVAPHIRGLRIGKNMVAGSNNVSIQLDDTDSGLLLNRLTSTQIAAITTPVRGLLVYNTTTNALQVYNGTAWVAVGSSSGGSNIRSITSGTSDSIVPASDYLVQWKSAATSAKAETLPAGTAGVEQTVIIKDVQGTAATYNITITGSGCTIDSVTSYVMNTNKASITLIWDGVSNWNIC